MDAVTYPTPEVQETLARDFVAVHINTYDPDGPTKRLIREFRKQWSPLLVWLEHHGIEVRRQHGYLPPREFLAECGFARGYAALVHARYADARAILKDVADRWPETDTAPEALFWAGVAANRAGDREAFLRLWQNLKAGYPRSTWWSRASFVEELNR